MIRNVESRVLYAAKWMGGDPNLWFTEVVNNYFDCIENERRTVTARIFAFPLCHSGSLKKVMTSVRNTAHWIRVD